MLRDLCGAEALLDHAIALNPSEAWAWLFKCVVQGFRGEGESALTSAERAMELSPLDPMHHYFEGLAASAALAARRLPLAIELAGRSLRASRDHLPTLRALAIAQMEAGDGDAGRLSVARIMSLDPSFTISRYLARAPVGSESTRRRYAQALQEGGVPHG
jgi:tetratricopeptide (TPR) repeat protein